MLSYDHARKWIIAFSEETADASSADEFDWLIVCWCCFCFLFLYCAILCFRADSLPSSRMRLLMSDKFYTARFECLQKWRTDSAVGCYMADAT